ncbi:MAG: protein-L-isoaspartate(D-aspartate) O-methyltransferase, partial [Chloroflexota bacterium]
RGIKTPAVLEALRKIPRHIFVPRDQRKWAYSDGALRIEQGQTISQPYIVALMTDALKLTGSESVLEVGTGSGYQAAILSQLVKTVHTIERHRKLSKKAALTIASLDIENILFHEGDGSLGLPEFAPFQAIMVTAAAPKAPQVLLDQLDDGGRLIIPVGARFSQTLELWRRKAGKFKREVIASVAFVPLIGEGGWDGPF